jgi:hypothetical protein
MRHTTEKESRASIESHYDLIESAIKTARMHMADEPGCRPDVVNFMFEFIGSLAMFGQQFKWPDPAKLAQAAQQDRALQQLLKRAAKPTPIRAGRALKGAK